MKQEAERVAYVTLKGVRLGPPRHPVQAAQVAEMYVRFGMTQVGVERDLLFARQAAKTEEHHQKGLSQRRRHVEQSHQTIEAKEID